MNNYIYLTYYHLTTMKTQMYSYSFHWISTYPKANIEPVRRCKYSFFSIQIMAYITHIVFEAYFVQNWLIRTLVDRLGGDNYHCCGLYCNFSVTHEAQTNMAGNLNDNWDWYGGCVLHRNCKLFSIAKKII